MFGVAGFDVFYQLNCCGNNPLLNAGATTDTTLNITSGLSIFSTYNFFVVSYGREDSTVLPSDHSNIATVALGE